MEPLSTREEFGSLVDVLVANGKLPELCQTHFLEFYELCGGLPREAREFGSLDRYMKWLTSGYLNFERWKRKHTQNRAAFYNDRIKRLLSRKDEIGEQLIKDSVVFAAKLFVGETMESAPQIWVDANNTVGIGTIQGRGFRRRPQSEILSSNKGDRIHLSSLCDGEGSKPDEG